ncbi:hypothetical protein [Asticcacaulis sp. EMRT-3]|uniref:hypothetical protein n=1 Tax=Asticcacaulis sp. EMRT-3 TaxID=3040349 RepID=UPI0024AEE64F|nr:hypothetical protein [Asticcacaulis sp. EMRT-3]MDI7775510.1 hypothetical protein [Asticcacaulis sp. EMRT-3]
MSYSETRLLRRKEASDYLAEKYAIFRKPVTLAKYATVGGGPAFRSAGRYPIYSVADLDKWAESIMSPLKTSTSDKGAE